MWHNLRLHITASRDIGYGGEVRDLRLEWPRRPSGMPSSGTDNAVEFVGKLPQQSHNLRLGRNFDHHPKIAASPERTN
jgi:hypothetical protein